MIVFAFWSPGPVEIIIILVIALLLFGKRLPEVGRSLGKGIIEFKRGIKGIEDEIEEESSRPTRLPPPRPSDSVSIDDEYHLQEGGAPEPRDNGDATAGDTAGDTAKKDTPAAPTGEAK